MEHSKEADEGLELVVKIDRPLFRNQTQFDEEYEKLNTYAAEPFSLRKRLKSRGKKCQCTATSSKKALLNFFPIFVWLPNYSLKKQFIGDFMAGCTVAIMHIPQGMGYGLLGGVSPIVGIYMAFFPVLLYCILGTSHHISLGTFAVTTLMTGQIVDKYATQYDSNATMHNETGTPPLNATDISNLDVAIAVCIMVGFWQIIMGVFKLGVLGIVLSDQLVSGFTTGAAIHVVVSQMKNLLGISVPRYNGALKLIYSTATIVNAIPDANPAEVITSAITITFMAVHNDWVKPWYSKKVKFPVPTELIVLIVATTIARYAHLDSDYGIKTLEHIPTGLPVPKSPPFELLPKIAIETIGTAIVAYAVSLSMAKIFARKRGYNVRNNQELLAQGISNVFGSFFSCMPAAASLSRSMLQESVGGETQLANVVSCMWLLAVLLWIGPFFESLPLSVLASIIIVALKGMFVQYKDFTHALKISPLDAAVWMATFLSVVIIDIDIGLAIGAVASVTVIIYRAHCPHHAVLGRLPGTEIYADVLLYPTAIEEPHIKVVRWVGGIQFSNAETFRRVVDGYLSERQLAPARQMNGKSPSNEHPAVETVNSLLTPANCDNNTIAVHVKYLILDCSALSYIDLAGTKFLRTLNSDLEKTETSLILAGCSGHVIEQLARCQFLNENVYPSVIDAVLSIGYIDVRGIKRSEHTNAQESESKS